LPVSTRFDRGVVDAVVHLLFVGREQLAAGVGGGVEARGDGAAV